MEMKGKSVEDEKEQACAIPMGMRINGLVDQYEDSINLEGILWTMNRRGGNLSGIGYLRWAGESVVEVEFAISSTSSFHIIQNVL